MKKAFDSVSKPLILLWQRLGVTIEIAPWLVDLDEAGFTFVRTRFALERWDLHGLLGVQPFAFNPERGTGQGDIHSPFTWLAVFDVLLTNHARTHPSTRTPIPPPPNRWLHLFRQGHLLRRRFAVFRRHAGRTPTNSRSGLHLRDGFQSLNYLSQTPSVPFPAFTSNHPWSRCTFWSTTRVGFHSGTISRGNAHLKVWGGVPHQPGRLDVLCCHETEAHPVYPSHLDQESLCPSGQLSPL